MKHLQTTIDKAAIGLSMLCMAHCLLLPIAMTALPVLAGLPLADESFHQLLLICVLPTSIIALIIGCQKHKNWNIAIWGISGLGILMLTALLGHNTLGELGEKLTTLVGSVIIAYGHFRNYKTCNTDTCHG